MSPRTSVHFIEFILLFESLVYAIEFANLAEESLLCSENGIIDVNNLGFNVMNKLVLQQGNIFLSPVGLAFSLGILYSSASNETAEQIENVLVRNGTEVTHEIVEEELNQLLQNLRDLGRNFSLQNEISFQDCKYINDEYVNILKDNFVDDVKVVEESDIIIRNRTVSDEDSLSEMGPKMDIINNLSFNDSWKVQFLEERTERDYFYSGRRETTEVWMMTIEGETFKFYEDLEMRYKFIELPYESDHMSMILALPTQYDHPAALQLDIKTFCRIKSKLIPTKLDMVSLPKFQFDEVTKVKDALITLGIEDAFNESLAKFPGLSNDEGFHISSVQQRVNLEVDEDGSKAASITSLKFKAFAFRGVKEFIANHPFLFYIEDRKTGTILLSGRIDEPSESISLSEHLHF